MFYFRADGNAVTGAGHLMRCLTIADELNRQRNSIPGKAETGKGYRTDEICFLCADEASAALTSERGYRTVVLHTDSACMEQELPVIEKLLGQTLQETVFLVDSYDVTEAYLDGLGAYGKVLLLDDMCKQAYPVDCVINYNAFAQEEAYAALYAGRETRFYTGSSFVPIRPQFLDQEYQVREKVSDVLITTGGGDSQNIAAQILRAIWNPQWTYHVIVGQFNPHFQTWKQWEAQCLNLCIHHDVKDMAGLMRQCDLAVTAGGTTIYELAAIGVPFLCFSYAQNQEALTAYVGDKQIAANCGAYHLEKEAVLLRMKERAEAVGSDYKLRLEMCAKERAMIDGKGAGRLAKILMAYGKG